MGPVLTWVRAYGSGHMGLGIWVQSYGSRHMGLPNVQPDFHVPCFMGPKIQDPNPRTQIVGPGTRQTYMHNTETSQINLAQETPFFNFQIVCYIEVTK